MSNNTDRFPPALRAALEGSLNSLYALRDEMEKANVSNEYLEITEKAFQSIHTLFLMVNVPSTAKPENP